MDLETFGRYFDQGVKEMEPDKVPELMMQALGLSNWKLWSFPLSPWARWEHGDMAQAVPIPVVIGCAYDPQTKTWLMIASARISHVALSVLSYPEIVKVARELETTSGRSASGEKALRLQCRLYHELLPGHVYSAMQTAIAEMANETHIY